MQMKTGKRAALAAASCLFLVCPAAHADFFGSVWFDDLALASTYNVGDSDVTDGVTITFDTFYWLPGDIPTNNGFAEVHNDQDAGGTGFDLETNNINAHFDFGADAIYITLLYGAFGGNLNLIINGTLTNVNDWSTINGSTIEGVDVTVGVIDDSHGSITLSGVISSFAIGGQELWIDDFQYKLVPAPGAMALLLPIVLGGMGRRRR